MTSGCSVARVVGDVDAAGPMVLGCKRARLSVHCCPAHEEMFQKDCKFNLWWLVSGGLSIASVWVAVIRRGDDALSSEFGEYATRVSIAERATVVS